MNLFLLSKHRSPLMGIAIILVVLFHAPHIFPDTFFDLVQSQGNLGVDIFFLISGIGLFFSWTKNPDASQFLKKRFLRILPTYLIVAVAWHLYYCVYKEFHFSAEGIWQFLYRVTNLRFWIDGDLTDWYIPSILAFYLLVPSFFTFLKNTKSQFTFVLFLIIVILGLNLSPAKDMYLGRLFIVINRLPIFLLGLTLGKFVQQKTDLSKYSVIFCLIIFLLCFFSNTILQTDFYKLTYLVNIFTALSFCLLMSFILDRIKTVGILSFCGSITLEIYLLNERCLQMVPHSSPQRDDVFRSHARAERRACILIEQICQKNIKIKKGPLSSASLLFKIVVDCSLTLLDIREISLILRSHFVNLRILGTDKPTTIIRMMRSVIVPL